MSCGDLVTTFPTWAVYLLSFGSPVLAFVGVMFGQYISRRGARELEIRSKREEVMRNLRWAAELAVSDDEDQARLGVEQLRALLESRMLGSSEEGFVYAALRAAIKVPVQEIEQAGGDAQVLATSSLPTDPLVDVPSETVTDELGGGGA